MDYRSLHTKVLKKLETVINNCDNLLVQTGDHTSNTFVLVDENKRELFDELCDYKNKLVLLEDKLLKKVQLYK